MKTKTLLIILILSLITIFLVGCDSLATDLSANKEGKSIQASGVIEAEQIALASELSGRISEIFVKEGDKVSAGDLVLTLDDDLLLTQKAQVQAQYDAAQAQLEGAKAAENAARAFLNTAEINLDAAKIQYQQVLSQVQFQEGSDRVDGWNESTPSQTDLPAWYFQQSEQISAAEEEVSSAWDFYQSELKNFQNTAADIGSEEFQKSEQRLVKAQAAFEVADILNDRQVGYEGREKIEDFVNTIYDSAETELKAAQKAYDQILADPEYDEILESRARVSVSKERYDIARDYLNAQLKGEYSLDVQAADTLVAQAEAGVVQAKAQITQVENNRISAATVVQQAEAALDYVNLQLEKLQIYSPITGVVLTRTVEPGEVLAAGFTALTVGDLAHLTVTVYLPEDRYGQVKLGDLAELTIDSFPDDAFDAEVLRIADEAEYTPRNVQTQEERQNTVYAVKLAVQNKDGKLKPGMPADVQFMP